MDWAVNLDKKGYFVGRRALEREKREGSSWKLMGFEIAWESLEALFADVGMPPQIPAMAVRASLPVMHEGTQVGYASTSTWSPVSSSVKRTGSTASACPATTSVSMTANSSLFMSTIYWPLVARAISPP